MIEMILSKMNLITYDMSEIITIQQLLNESNILHERLGMYEKGIWKMATCLQAQGYSCKLR